MGSFEQGPGLLACVGDLQVSVSTMRALTYTAGDAVCAVEAAELALIERTLPEAARGAARQLVSVDGAMVPLTGGEWREVRTLAVGRVTQGADGTVTTDGLSYFSRMTNAELFMSAATIELHRRGTEHAATVVAVADGAAWCQSFFDLHVPRSRRILDFPHAVEHLSAVAQAVFGSGTAAASDWLGVHRHALRHGNPDTVLAAMAALPVETARDPAAARAVRDRELAYFTTRRALMTYPEFVAAGLPIGSGAVESANKLVVEARLKGAGMHWAADHVNPMVALRAALCSNRWDERWGALTAQQRTRPARTANTVVPTAATLISTPPVPSVAPPPPPKPKTVIDGKPTEEHPWKGGGQNRPQIALPA